MAKVKNPPEYHLYAAWLGIPVEEQELYQNKE